MKLYLKAFKQYADFKGRASRSEFWMFSFLNVIFSFIAALLDNTIGITIANLPYGYIYMVYSLAVLIPALAVTVRRLHDIGKSGWMTLILLIPAIGTIWLLVLLVFESKLGKNEYGEYIQEIQNENHIINTPSSELLILIISIWFFTNAFSWKILDFISEFYNLHLYDINIFANFIFPLMNFIWALIPICLGIIVKNKTYRIIIFILGGIYLSNTIYSELSRFLETTDDFIYFQF